MSRSRRVSLTLLLGGILTVPGLAAAGSNGAGLPDAVKSRAEIPGAIEVTSSPDGDAIVASAVARFAERWGMSIDPRDLRVWDTGGGGYLVAPSWVTSISISKPTLTATARELSFDFVAGDHMSAPENAGLVAAAGDVRTAVAPYWQLVENGCFARIQNGSGYFDTCYKINKLMSDGFADKDFYALNHYGTTGPLNGQTVDWARIWSDEAAGSAAMSWSDWGPRGDLSQGQGTCTNFTFGVSVGAVLSFTKWACEIWNMTKWADAAHYQMEWNCNCAWGITSDREVAYVTEITVGQNLGPLWTVGATFNA